MSIDRPAAIRRATSLPSAGSTALRWGLSPKAAGVAAGTAYVHYESKEELVHASYLEIKRELSEEVLPQVDLDAAPKERFVQLWTGIYHHYRAEPAPRRVPRPARGVALLRRGVEATRGIGRQAARGSHAP